MGKMKKGRAGKRVDVKKTNKARNKLAKRGKLKKKERKIIGAWYKHKAEKRRRVDAEKMYVDLEEQRRREEEEEDALPLDMMDSDEEMMQHVDQDTKNFLSLSDLENRPRSFGENGSSEIRHLLPIKRVDGRLITQTVQVEEEEEDQASQSAALSNEDNAGDEETEGQEELSVVELYAKREHILAEFKEKIASVCLAVIENPQEKITKLRDLLSVAGGEGIPVMIRSTVQKLAMASVGEVFADIIPGYRIRELSDAEKRQQMTKETRQLVSFEEALLRYYKKYLQLLEKQCGKLPKKRSDTADAKCHKKMAMGKLALHSLCKLMLAHPHFNYRSNIMIVLAPLMSHWHQEIRDLVCQSIQQLFQSDRVGEATLDAVKAICQYIKNNQKMVHGRMVATLSHLRIKEVEKKDSDGKSKKDRLIEKKKKMLAMSRKEKKMQKRLKCLEQELEEVELAENTSTIIKRHTDIMNQVFATYFRILRHSPTSKLLPEVLAGLSKFAHLINVELVDELVSSLRELIEAQTLKPLEKLHCIRTAFVVLSGEGYALTVDPYRFYICLYTLLPKLLQETARAIQLEQFTVCLECLDLMINRRRKQISLSRVTAFTKRLCQLCLIMAQPECAACLVALRSFFIAHPQLETVLDEDTLGSGAYKPDVDDPEHCNALSTTILHELDLLSRHSNELIRRLAFHLRFKLPSQGRHGLSTDLTSVSPWELLNKLAWSGEHKDSACVNSQNVVKNKLKKLDKDSNGSSVEEFCRSISAMMKFR